MTTKLGDLLDRRTIDYALTMAHRAAMYHRLYVDAIKARDAEAMRRNLSLCDRLQVKLDATVLRLIGMGVRLPPELLCGEIA